MAVTRELEGRVALITGAPKNIGRAIAEVTALVRLLCSPKGRYIAGQTLHVNGGFYMNA